MMRDRVVRFGRLLWPGIKHGWVPIALALLAHVPGRRAFAANEEAHGRPGFLQLFTAGIFADLVYVGPPLLLLLVICLATQQVLVRRGASAKTIRVASMMGVALIGLLLASAWMFAIGAIEAKLRRGIYPTYLELEHSLGSSSFAVGMLPTLLLGRYWKASLVTFAFAAAVLVHFWRRTRVAVVTTQGIIGFVLGALVPYLVACEMCNLDRVFFPLTGGEGETRSPISIVLAGKLPWTKSTGVAVGFRERFAALSYSREEKRSGLRALGYPAADVDALIAFENDKSCSAPHPLRQPLDRPLLTAPRSDGDELLDDVEELSRALFEGRDEPVTVWQVVMESFRADDINALNEKAPPELTPVMNRLYRERDKAFTFGRAFQGGLRTAQALTSVLCGVGTFPFVISVGRDLGHFPLRCLPDVLADGGFDFHVYYPSDISFDNMLEFFRQHGAKSTQAVDMPRGLPTGTWGSVSDRALYTQALKGASPDRSEVEFILTLSGHSPFTRPTDMPPEATAAAESACKKMIGAAADGDDCDRAAVVAYADYALGEFLDQLEKSPVARRSIVVISGDHSTNEEFLWGDAVEKRARAQVPYVVYLPKALRESAPKRERIGPLLDRLGDRARLVWSLTDSPTLVTTLVSAAPQMRRIPAAWRWHTLGGQATSHDFAIDGKPEARAWGTDADAFVFTVTADGVVSDSGKKNEAFSDPSQFDSMNPLLRGPAAFLSSFTKGFVAHCEQDTKLRMKD